MNLNFGDIAGVLGRAGSGILGGMREADVENQKLAMAKALQAAQIENLHSEETYRAQEGSRLDALTNRINTQDTRRRAMIPSLLGEINSMKSEIGEPTLDTTNPDQYDPDDLQQQVLRLTPAVESFRSRQDARNYNQQSHADIVRERKRSAIQNELLNIEQMNQKANGFLLNPNSPMYNGFVHSRYLTLQKQRHQMDMEDMGTPLSEPQGGGAGNPTPGSTNPAPSHTPLPPASSSASPDVPGKTMFGSEGQYFPGSATTPSPNQTSRVGGESQASPDAVSKSLSDRMVDYANSLMAQGIPRAMAIQRAKNEVK